MKFRVKNRITDDFVSIPLTWEDATKLKNLLELSCKDDRYEIVPVEEGIKGWDGGKPIQSN